MPRLFANRVRTAQILLLVVVIVGALYVMDAVVGSGLVRRPYQVTVNLAGERWPLPGLGGELPRQPDRQDHRPRRHPGRRPRDGLDRQGHPDPGRLRGGRLQPLGGRRAAAGLPAAGRPRPVAEGGSVVAEKDTGLPLATSTFFLHAKTLTDQIDVNDVHTISTRARHRLRRPRPRPASSLRAGRPDARHPRTAPARHDLADRARPGAAADRLGQQRPVPAVQQGRARRSRPP